MDEHLFNNLSLEGKANFVKEKGTFVDAQDYYSYRVLSYSLENHEVEILYDFSGTLINVELTEKRKNGDFLSSQLEDCLGDSLPPA